MGLGKPTRLYEVAIKQVAGCIGLKAKRKQGAQSSFFNETKVAEKNRLLGGVDAIMLFFVFPVGIGNMLH